MKSTADRTSSLHYVYVNAPHAEALSLKAGWPLFAAFLLLLLTACGGSGPAPTYTIGADVSGLSGKGLVLQLSNGTTLAVTANGVATFATSLASGKRYQIAVQTQPSSPQQVCSVADGSGTIGASNVTVAVTCVTTYAVGVSVSGLSGTGLVFALNDGNNLAVSSNGSATFATRLASGASYQVTVARQPSSPQQICSVAGGSGTIGTGNVTVAVTCVTFSTLYSFTGGSDGSVPTGTLVQGRSDGNLYGTTFSGGGGRSFYDYRGTIGIGTVFRIDLAGNETVLYAFNYQDLPSLCEGGLTQGSDGNFYGAMTGYFGGNYAGEQFKVTPAGVETILAEDVAVDIGDELRFECGLTELSDGYLYEWTEEGALLPPYQVEQGPGLPTPALGTPPVIGLSSAYILQVSDDTFYIMEWGDGSGDIIKVVAGTATSLGSVGGYLQLPGNLPIFGGSFGGPLIQGTDGNLYGTAAAGGSGSGACPNGCGTVLRVTPAGVITVLYSFGGNAADGQTPSGALIQGIDGNFYGLTLAGGNTPPGSATPNCNCGTIFRITPAGEETVLYSFGTYANDGKLPSGALLQASDGNFYGTTQSGGASNDGTVFKLVVGAN